MKHTIYMLKVALLFLVLRPGHADPVLSLDAQSLGECRALASHNELLAAGCGTVLLLLDVSDPEHPVELSRRGTGHLIEDLALDHPHDYVANQAGGLLAMAIDGEGQLHEIDRVAIPGNAMDLAVDGDLLVWLQETGDWACSQLRMQVIRRR